MEPALACGVVGPPDQKELEGEAEQEVDRALDLDAEIGFVKGGVDIDGDEADEHGDEDQAGSLACGRPADEEGCSELGQTGGVNQGVAEGQNGGIISTMSWVLVKWAVPVTQRSRNSPARKRAARAFMNPGRARLAMVRAR